MDRSIFTVLIEAVAIGFATLIIGWLLERFGPVIPFPWNLFVIGMAIHLAFEYSPLGNLNRLYCLTNF